MATRKQGARSEPATPAATRGSGTPRARGSDAPQKPAPSRSGASGRTEAAETQFPSEETTSEELERRHARIIAIANQKGGVGKSTTAVSLGAALAEIGYRVLVVDLDPQGNASTGMGIRQEAREVTVYDVLSADGDIERAIVPTVVEGLDAVPSTIDLAGAEIELVSQFSRELRLRRAIEQIRDGSYDFVFLDCPPSLGLLTVNALAAAEELLVPIQCEYYALEGLGQLLRNVRLVQQNVNPNLRLTGIVLTMFDPRTKLSEQVVAEVRRYFADRVYDVVIPRTVRLSEAPGYGQPITQYDPRSRGAESYRELAREVIERPPALDPLPPLVDLPQVRPEPKTEPLPAPTPSEVPSEPAPRAEPERAPSPVPPAGPRSAEGTGRQKVEPDVERGGEMGPGTSPDVALETPSRAPEPRPRVETEAHVEPEAEPAPVRARAAQAASPAPPAPQVESKGRVRAPEPPPPPPSREGPEPEASDEDEFSEDVAYVDTSARGEPPGEPRGEARPVEGRGAAGRPPHVVVIDDASAVAEERRRRSGGSTPRAPTAMPIEEATMPEFEQPKRRRKWRLFRRGGNG